MSHITLDIETSVKNKDKPLSKCGMGSPHYHENKIVVGGWTLGSLSETSRVEKFTTAREVAKVYKDLDQPMIVGHNIAFDFMYLLHDGWDLKEDGIPIVWDTMIVEYLLSGQSWKYPSLDKVCEKYGLTTKDARLKSYWDEGVDTEDIPKEILIPYLEHDVLVTDRVYTLQLEQVIKRGMRALVYDELRARMATIIMEFNGMAFSTNMRDTIRNTVENEWELEYSNAVSYMLRLLNNVVEKEEVNPLSDSQLSTVIFGGELKVVRDIEQLDEHGTPLRFKTGIRKGQKKTRKEKVSVKVDAIYPVAPPSEWVASSGKVSCNNDVLKTILTDSSLVKLHSLIDSVMRLRKYQKEIKTYLTGYGDLKFRDGYIHPTFNHCDTSTGRLSCRLPNLQNITKTET